MMKKNKILFGLRYLERNRCTPSSGGSNVVPNTASYAVIPIDAKDAGVRIDGSYKYIENLFE